MRTYSITKKGYRKILKWAANNISDDFLDTFSMECLLDDQEIDYTNDVITLILEGSHIAGGHSILTLFLDKGDLK